MKRPEQVLHRQVAQLLDSALDGGWWCHVPNGGARSKIEAAILKGLGVKPGTPDMLIISRGVPIWIELKAGKNKPTAVQSACHDALWAAGALVLVCRSIDEVIKGLRGFKVPLRISEAA